MLLFFPMPYPDEWWYSVLCRYHVRSGNRKFMTTVSELLNRSHRAAINSLVPNSTVFEIINQLPSKAFNLEDILFHHTLLPYHI